jgi:hypothetical protein
MARIPEARARIDFTVLNRQQCPDREVFVGAHPWTELKSSYDSVPRSVSYARNQGLRPFDLSCLVQARFGANWQLRLQVQLVFPDRLGHFPLLQLSESNYSKLPPCTSHQQDGYPDATDHAGHYSQFSEAYLTEESIQGKFATSSPRTRRLNRATLGSITGRSVDEFRAEVTTLIPNANDNRWKRPYTDLTYLPMQEVPTYFHANGYKTDIMTGGAQGYRDGRTAGLSWLFEAASRVSGVASFWMHHVVR